MRSAAIALTFCLAANALAGTPPVKADLSGIGFLVGRWESGTGTVAETGGTSKGTSVVTVEANGEALLRRDHTDLFDSNGKPSGSFDQIMLIYPDNGGLHADYSDGQHVIHYMEAAVVAGKSVTFSTAAQAVGPAFRLRYGFRPPNGLSVQFEMKLPGQSEFRPVASGTLKRRS